MKGDKTTAFTVTYLFVPTVLAMLVMFKLVAKGVICTEYPAGNVILMLGLLSLKIMLGEFDTVKVIFLNVPLTKVDGLATTSLLTERTSKNTIIVIEI